MQLKKLLLPVQGSDKAASLVLYTPCLELLFSSTKVHPCPSHFIYCLASISQCRDGFENEFRKQQSPFYMGDARDPKRSSQRDQHSQYTDTRLFCDGVALQISPL